MSLPFELTVKTGIIFDLKIKTGNDCLGPVFAVI